MNRKFTLGILVVFSILMFICFSQYHENQKYENYLSYEIANMISTLSSRILDSSLILNEVLKNKSVSKVQLEQLESNFSAISKYSQEVFYLATTINRANENEINNFPSTISSEIQFHLYHLGKTMNENTTLHLGSKDLQMMQLYKEFSDKSSTVISENVIGATPDGMKEEYWDRYLKDGINDGYWIEVMKGLSKYAVENKNIIGLRQ